ncbi:SAF domain-containing protein, partial [Paenibacillus septentrionalis]
MTAFSSATPSRRRPWGDVRFVVGIVLIVVSVAGVWFVASAARHTTPVYVAARTIVPGETITDADLRLVDVALGATADGYLADGALVGDTVTLRTIAAGELVPLEAMGDAAEARSTGIVVQ